VKIREEFIHSIQDNQAAFGPELTLQTISRLADYFEMVMAANPLLHLVAPCTPGEFAARHILESLTLLEFLPINAKFADVGAGAGLPSIPCLIARADLRAVIIESKEKKSAFLQDVLSKLELGDRVRLISRQFSETERPDVTYITCRALDRFTQNLPRLLKWSGDARCLFFGGDSMRQELEGRRIRFSQKLMPLSERRYLYIF
jgi:16S rRNA (guanine527-N7)-methyltransferase